MLLAGSVGYRYPLRMQKTSIKAHLIQGRFPFPGKVHQTPFSSAIRFLAQLAVVQYLIALMEAQFDSIIPPRAIFQLITSQLTIIPQFLVAKCLVSGALSSF